METGRPTKYKQEYNKQAEKICSMFGADDEKLAEYFGVCKTTIQTWKKEYPEFLVSLKTGKDIFDTKNVEKSLLERAMGFQYTEKVEDFTDPVLPKVLKVQTKQALPETTAAIFWLKNRNPKRWKDRKAVELTGDDGGPIKTVNATITPEMDAKEAASIYSQMLKDE